MEEPEQKGKLVYSGAGIAVALVVIVLFVLAALVLKSLVFGIIAAYFLMPLEKFFERKVFSGRSMTAFSGFLFSLTSPFRSLRNRLMRSKPAPSPEELAHAKRERLVLKSTIAAFLTCVIAVLLFLSVSASILIPAAINTGRSVTAWAAENEVLKNAENKLVTLIDKDKTGQKSTSPAVKQGETATAATGVRASFDKLRPQLRHYLDLYGSELAMFAFAKGKGVIATIFSIASYLGKFAFDILLFVFFFLFFIQKMAMFRDDSGKSNPGEWCVQGLFNTAWLPSAGKDARNEAAGIINAISDMFNRWVRGYISIILIESVLYVTLFSALSVPYAIPLGILSGFTILLPFIGPLACVSLTLAVCVGFCETHLLITLAGVGLVYLLVNGILEQLILYPSLVGGAIGLSTIETIIVVLLGGLFMGITGMLLAVPVAAIIKYLIPRIYAVWILPHRRKRAE